MLETVAIFLVGFLPGLFSFVVVRKIRTQTRERLQSVMMAPTVGICRPHPYFQALDYQYVEGSGYMVGDITCKYNAHSAYLRCAVNPSGPCQGCPKYESKL
jgi:Family of unknown function (DUF6464)